jgi:hypothetical protein
LQILYYLVGHPPLEGTEFAFDLPFCFGDAIELDAVFCRGLSLVVYSLAQDLPEDTLFHVEHSKIVGSQELLMGGEFYVDSILGPTPAPITTTFGHANSGVEWYQGRTDRCAVYGLAHKEFPAGTVTFYQQLTYEDAMPKFCKRECCGGVYGLGNITGGDIPSIADALQVLRYLVKLPNLIDTDENARIAAGFHDSQITISPALDIMRFVVGLPSELDRFYPRTPTQQSTTHEALQVLRHLAGLPNTVVVAPDGKEPCVEDMERIVQELLSSARGNR